MRGAWSLVAGILLIAACLGACSGVLPGQLDGPADPDARMAPDLIVADPATIAPGGIVALTFPEETVRGVLFVLEMRAGDSWAHRYDLLSDGPGPGWQRSWHIVGEEAIAVPDIGVGGPGPDRVVIPEIAPAGEFRLCTGNAGENICTPIEIVNP